MSDKAKPSHIERTVYVQPDVTPGSSVRYGSWEESIHHASRCANCCGSGTARDNSWRDVRCEVCRGSGRVRPLPLTIIELATSSDYSGSLVEISNARSLKRSFPWLVEIYGGHGTRALGYLGKRENQSDALIEAIDGLTEYPLFDEDDHSELEMETAAEAWESDGRDDFKRALVKMWALDDSEYDEDKLPDDAIDTLWRDCCELLRGGEEYLNEQGDSIYFPIDRVIEDIRRDRRDLYRATWNPDDNRPIIEKLESLRAIALVTDNTEQTNV